jgi:hypothetical protein
MDPQRGWYAAESMSGPEVNVVLRAVADDAWSLNGRRFAPLAAVAVDLCSYADPRAARVGAETIAGIDRDMRAV